MNLNNKLNLTIEICCKKKRCSKGKNIVTGITVGSISTVSRVRSLILPEERRLDAWHVDLVCDVIGKLITYWSLISLEVKPVSNFLVYLVQNCIYRSRANPNDFRNSFLVHFCTLWHAVNFLWSSNGWKKRSKRRCSEKIKWKSLWFTRQNFQRIECFSVKHKRGRLHLERTQLSRPKAPWKDHWRCKISPTTIIERRVHNKQPNKTLCSFRTLEFRLVSPRCRNR